MWMSVLVEQPMVCVIIMLTVSIHLAVLHVNVRQATYLILINGLALVSLQKVCAGELHAAELCLGMQ